MSEYAKYNAKVVLENVNDAIEELEEIQGVWSLSLANNSRYLRVGWRDHWALNMRAVCHEFSIFDWWKDELSVSQLNQMQRFIEIAIKLGFDGYVCFKVGSIGCANGMWAYKEESTNGYSPEGDCLYHSFVSNENYWDVKLNEQWSNGWDRQLKLADIKRIIAETK